MGDYQRMTDEELTDFTSRVVVQLEPTLTRQVISLISELTEYRTKIEKGTLFELPCKVGDIVYEIFYSQYEARILEMKVIQIVMQETISYQCKTTNRCLYNYGWVKNEDFGKTVFLTEAKAKEKLKELQNVQT